MLPNSPLLIKAIKDNDIATAHDCINRGEHILGKVVVQLPWTLLHIAAWRGYTEMATLLVEEGRLQIDARDHKDNTPLHGAIELSKTDTALALIKLGADINVQNKGDWTPMHFAADTGQAEVAIALADGKIMIDVADKNRQTAMHIAAKRNDVAIAKLLAKWGWQVYCCWDKDLKTPLDIAKECYETGEMVDFLLSVVEKEKRWREKHLR